jgi:hypothetical protein
MLNEFMDNLPELEISEVKVHQRITSVSRGNREKGMMLSPVVAGMDE